MCWTVVSAHHLAGVGELDLHRRAVEQIARYYGASDMKVLNYGAKKEFVDRYDIQELLRANHLTDELIVEDIRKIIG